MGADVAGLVTSLGVLVLAGDQFVIGVGSFSCQDNVHSVAFNAGDLFSISVTTPPGLNKSSLTTMRYTALFTGS